MNWLRRSVDSALAALKQSVRKKLMLMVLVTTLIALLLTGAAMVIYDLRTYHKAWVGDLFAQADLIGRASAPALLFQDEKVAHENLALLRIRPQISAAAIYAANGTLFATYERPGGSAATFPRLPENEGYRVEGDQLVLFKRIQSSNEIVGTVYLRTRYELVERLETYLVILGVVMAASLLAALLLTAWLQRALTEPILAMADVARHVMVNRDFSLRVRRTTEDEIGYLVDTFNQMLAEIGERAKALEETNRTLEHEMDERRSAERSLIAADRRKDEFLATLAHELRNPLAPLRNALEILRTSGNDTPAGKSARDMMERQLRQLVHLVNDLLDVSRITTGKMVLRRERVELGSVVQNALEAAHPLINMRKHKLSVALPPGHIYVSADATRLAQVFLNLLNNAAKFTDDGGGISFKAEVMNDDLVVTVADTGIGIPQDMLPVIFDMFAQVDRSLERTQAGLGVGLSLAKHLTELHGGSITAFSDGVGRGARFVVRLPIVIAAERDVGAGAAGISKASDSTTYRILLADDNVDFAASLAMILQVLGHDVHVTHDGQEALEAAARVKPEFAFLDIGLPKMNGYDLARKLRSMPGTESSILVAITGWGQEDDKRRAREAGFDRHLVKPVEPEQIQSILQELAPGAASLVR